MQSKGQCSVMESRRELLEEVMRQVQKEYVHIVEIESLTKEIGNTLARDDRESVQILLELRQTEMEQADEAKEGVRTILEAVDADMRRLLIGLLEEQDTRTETGSFEEEKIVELSHFIRKSLKEIIQIDKVISCKLAGKDSYYKQ